MTLRELDYICAVARFRHFGKAARACHVSQPTLSSQIIKLETELGVSIFERMRGSVRLTAEGAEIIELAKQVRQAIDDIKSLSTSYRDPFAGNLNLGVIPTIGPFLLPYFSGPLLKTYPKLKLAYIEDMTERLTDHLLAGQLDAAILATQPLDPALTCMPLYNENFFVALPHSHRLCGQDEVSLSDLDDVQMLLLTEGHCLRDQALSVCSTATQNQAVRATSLETLLGLVAGGHGVTLIPALAIRTGCISELGIDIRPISDPQAFRRVNLTYRKSHVRPQIFDSLTGLISSKLPPSVSGIKV